MICAAAHVGRACRACHCSHATLLAVAFGLLVLGCSSEPAGMGAPEASMMLPPGAAPTAMAVGTPPVWRSSIPTVPRAVSRPEPFVIKPAYAPVVAKTPTAKPGLSSAKPQAAGGQHIQPLSRDLRVMTFNLRVRTIFDGLNIWDVRRDSVVQRIRAFDPDLLGTQEGLNTMEDYLRDQLAAYTFFGG